MLTRKTQYGWMALGGLICLFGLVLACKLRDNKVVAQADKPAVEVPMKEDKSPLLEPPSPGESKHAAEFNTSLPPMKVEIRSWKTGGDKTSAPAETKKVKSEPALMIGRAPLAEPSPKTESASPAMPPFLPPPSATKNLPPPSTSGPVLPVSFSTNTPAPSDSKPTKSPKAMSETPAKHSTQDVPPPPPPMPSFAPPPPAADKAMPSGLSLPAKPPTPAWAPPPPTETKVSPTGFAPVSPASPSIPPSPEHEAKSQPGEPPLAPAPGPVQLYHVHGSETLQDIARRTLGSAERWTDLHKLNPTLKTDGPLSSGTTVRLPGDACVQTDDAEPVKPLPILRVKTAPPKTKVLPLTGTFLCSLDEKGRLTLPRVLRDQLAGSETVLVSPGPDKCLWLTNHPHLERLAERLDQSGANEADVRVFKRLYFAQTEKLSVNSEGRVQIPERLTQFAGLHQELVLVGIDDHFEVWDAARWRQYTRQKSTSASRSTAAGDAE